MACCLKRKCPEVLTRLSSLNASQSVVLSIAAPDCRSFLNDPMGTNPLMADICLRRQTGHLLSSERQTSCLSTIPFSLKDALYAPPSQPFGCFPGTPANWCKHHVSGGCRPRIYPSGAWFVRGGAGGDYVSLAPSRTTKWRLRHERLMRDLLAPLAQLSYRHPRA